MTHDLETASRATVDLVLNGDLRRLDVDPRRTLADLLRDDLGLTGTHLGCEHGVCGACTVLVDGRSVRACVMLAVQAEGCEVTTIEGLSPEDGLSPLQQAMSEQGGLQCGFCTPGIVVAATELLRDDPNVDEVGVRSALSGNLCRCTGYEGIVDAVLSQRGVDLGTPNEPVDHILTLPDTGPLADDGTSRDHRRIDVSSAGSPAPDDRREAVIRRRGRWAAFALVAVLVAVLVAIGTAWRRYSRQER